MTTAAKFDVRHRSRIVADGADRAAARAMLRAVGVGDKELEQPFIGVANTASDVTPCNVHLDKLAERVKAGVKSAAGTPFEFGVLTVSDGISMGTEGMKASLVSRELIADSIELVSHGEYFDGLVTIAGCDKNLPGAMMAAARLNIPTVFLYSGTIMPGRYAGRDISIQDVFEAIGAHSKGRISDSDLKDIECAACPGAGSCGGMFTANTMSSTIEAMGMALPGASSEPAVEEGILQKSYEAGRTVMRLLEQGIRPRDILTKEAFENGIAVAVSMGGSTNVVLHLLAIAYEAGVDLSIEDFHRISERTPYIADMKPGGRYLMVDLHREGGVPTVMKRLLDAGLLHGSAMTVTGKTIEENLADVKIPESSKVVHPVAKPLSPHGSMVILEGQPCARGSGGEAGSSGGPEQGPPGPGEGVQQGAGRLPGRGQPGDRAGRRSRAALRGAQGRARNEGDASRDRGHSRAGVGGGRGFDNRRPVLGGDAGVHGWACGAGSDGRWADCGC